MDERRGRASQARPRPLRRPLAASRRGRVRRTEGRAPGRRDALGRRADAGRAAHLGDGRGAAGPGGPDRPGRRAAETSTACRARHALRPATPACARASARMLGEIGDEAALTSADLLRRARPRRGRAARGRARGRVVRARRHRHPLHPCAGSPRTSASSRTPRRPSPTSAIRGPSAYVVKRMTSHGCSARNFVSFLNQVSYVRDYDVEIAQASNIANPDVATIQDGVVLDVSVIDAGYTKTWIEPILVGAASRLAGREVRQPRRGARVVRRGGRGPAGLPVAGRRGGASVRAR